VRRRLSLLVAAAVALAIAWYFGLGERRPGARVERLPVGAFGEFVAPAPPPLADGPVDHVVLLVGDGLGLPQLAAARLHAYGPEGRLRLERLPVSGLLATHPDGALVTKSDAAATALATGTKTRNGRVGVDGAGRPLNSLAAALHAAGGAVGLVTTSSLADATPAAFGAHAERRADTAGIARQLVSSGFELMLGGGRGDFDLAAARAAGYRVAERPEELAGADLPLLGLFAENKLPIGGEQPSLEQMTRAALARLAATGRRSFLLVEDEGIDTAGHARKLGDLATALVAFDAAVGAAVEHAARDGRTLVLVTGDHATGALAIDAASTADRLVVRWSSDGHTGEPVPLFAYGPGAGRFAGLSDNTELARRIASLLGVEIGAPSRE